MQRDKIEKALEYSRAILDSLKLSAWAIEVDNSYTVIAKTEHDNKKIVYSKRFITIASIEDFRRATIHEATHALLGMGKGHGKEFVELCNRLSPDEPYDNVCQQFPIHNYKLHCNECGSTTTSTRKVDEWCRKCASNAKLSKLEVSVNKLQVLEWASIP